MKTMHILSESLRLRALDLRRRVGRLIRLPFPGAVSALARMLEYLDEFNVYSRRRRWRERRDVTYCYEKSLAVWPSLIWDSQERLLYLHWLHAILCWGFEWPRRFVLEPQLIDPLQAREVRIDPEVLERVNALQERWAQPGQAVLRGMGPGEEAVNNFFVQAQAARDLEHPLWDAPEPQEPEDF